VTSLKDRQRAAARARLEREMADRAKVAQKRRQRSAIIGAAVAVVVLAGIVILIVATSGGKKPSPSAANSASPSASAVPVSCQWVPNPDPSASPAPAPNPKLKNVGTPPTDNIADSGTQDMVINTNLGQITIQMDVAKAPCTAASFAYLASKKFFDGSSCHRLLNQGDSHLLQCGDPTGTGQGGPTYSFADENLPANDRPAYVEGSVAMANSGANTNGSQFFIVFGDTDLPASYTLFGKVTQGLDIAKKVGQGGDDEAFASPPADGSQAPGGGHPKTKLTFNTVTVGPVQGASPAPSTASTTPAPSKS
jgi:peptidyl-prolyl cis-trans isomerase B (cyclophilin B)